MATCELKAKTATYCDGHYKRSRRYGDPLAGNGRGSPGKRRGFRSGAGRYVLGNGYVRVRTEAVGRALWMLEHRVVMERQLGRALYPDEQVHHKNGNRQDNDPANLELWTKRQPTGQRAEDIVAYAKEMLARYEPLPVS